MNALVKTIRNDIPGNHKYTMPTTESSKLVVGKGVVIKGEITECEHIVVEGKVEAELHGARKLEIIKPGIFIGSVDVQDAEIHGRFEGNMIVRGHLVVGSTGDIQGNIYYNSLDVSPGAVIHGNITTLPEEVSQLESNGFSENVENLFETTFETTFETSMAVEGISGFQKAIR